MHSTVLYGPSVQPSGSPILFPTSPVVQTSANKHYVVACTHQTFHNEQSYLHVPLEHTLQTTLSEFCLNCLLIWASNLLQHLPHLSLVVGLSIEMLMAIPLLELSPEFSVLVLFGILSASSPIITLSVAVACVVCIRGFLDPKFP